MIGQCRTCFGVRCKPPSPLALSLPLLWRFLGPADLYFSFCQIIRVMRERDLRT